MRVCVSVHVLTCMFHYPPVAGEDYDGGPYTVTFASDANMACTDVTIIDDEIFEGDQNFFIDIVVPPEVPLTPMGRANVTIQDDDTGDMPCKLQTVVVLTIKHSSICNPYRIRDGNIAFFNLLSQ